MTLSLLYIFLWGLYRAFPDNFAHIVVIFPRFALDRAAGSQPVLGFNYGARKFDRVRKAFLLDVGVCSAVTLLSWVIFQCFPLPLIRIFGAESELYEQFAVECFRVYLMLTFLNGLQMCTSVLFQATGQPVKAAVASLSKQLLFYIVLSENQFSILTNKFPI